MTGVLALVPKPVGENVCAVGGGDFVSRHAHSYIVAWLHGLMVGLPVCSLTSGQSVIDVVCVVFLCLHTPAAQQRRSRVALAHKACVVTQRTAAMDEAFTYTDTVGWGLLAWQPCGHAQGAVEILGVDVEIPGRWKLWCSLLFQQPCWCECRR